MNNNGSLLMFVYLQKKNLTLQNSLHKSYLKAGDNSSKKFFKAHFLSEKLQKGNLREDHYTFLKTFRSLISKTSIFKVRVEMKSRLLLFGGSNFNCCNFPPRSSLRTKGNCKKPGSMGRAGRGEGGFGLEQKAARHD